MKLDTALKIREKAKTKKDGIYTLGGCLYRVVNGRATHYASSKIHTIAILMNCGNFNCELAEFPWCADWRSVARKMLKEIK